MSASGATWAIAALQVLAAVGFIGYWMVWLRTEHEEDWLPPGYVDHEFPFVFTDSVITVLLLAGAVLQVMDRPAGRSIGLIAGGMLAFLAIIDTGYFARSGLFARHRDGVLNIAVVVAVALLAAILIVRFF